LTLSQEINLANQINRRRHPRSKVKIRYQLSKSTSKFVVTLGHTIDLSLGGVRFLTQQKLFPLGFVELQFESTDKNKKVILEGRVVWVQDKVPMDESDPKVKEYIVGVEFLNLHMESEKKIILELMRRIIRERDINEE